MFNFTVNTYQSFNIPLNCTQTPDSMNILIISSAGYQPQVGSKVLVDNIKATVESGAGTETWDLLDLSIYPNPTSEILYVRNLPIETRWEIYDTFGRRVKGGISQQPDEIINVADLPQGMYFFKAYVNDHNRTFTFVISN